METAIDEWRSGPRHDRVPRAFERLLAIQTADLTTALNQASQVVAEAFVADWVDIFLNDAGTDTLTVVASSTALAAMPRPGSDGTRHPSIQEGLVTRVYQTGAALVAGQGERDSQLVPRAMRDLGIRSLMGVPLSIGGQRSGVLLVASGESGFFRTEEVRLAEMLGRWVGLLGQRVEQASQQIQAATEHGRTLAAEDLIRGLAHDIGNVLTPLKARIDMIQRRAQREGRQRDQDDAVAAGQALQRLRALVENLLDAARLERGLLPLKIAPVDLAGLARESATACQTATTPITVEAPPALLADGDAGRLQQALQSVLANAVKYGADAGPIVITVGEEARGDVRFATLAVADQGPGIAPELLPRLFERFVTGPGSNGLGLGLYLARGIAAAHGGTLTAHSTPGQGATFTLAIPLSHREAP